MPYKSQDFLFTSGEQQQIYFCFQERINNWIRNPFWVLTDLFIDQYYYMFIALLASSSKGKNQLSRHAWLKQPLIPTRRFTYVKSHQITAWACIRTLNDESIPWDTRINSLELYREPLDRCYHREILHFIIVSPQRRSSKVKVVSGPEHQSPSDKQKEQRLFDKSMANGATEMYKWVSFNQMKNHTSHQISQYEQGAERE